MISTEPTAGRGALQSWSSIDWPTVERNVRRLQERIFGASQNGEPAKVKNLQKRLVRSSSAKLLAIRKATQINRGQRTPGIDGVVCHVPPRRLAMFRKGLSLKGYRPKPVRRIYIPKADGPMASGERPLGIPTMLDRVMQALVKLALEPEWEPRFETNSYDQLVISSSTFCALITCRSMRIDIMPIIGPCIIPGPIMRGPIIQPPGDPAAAGPAPLGRHPRLAGRTPRATGHG